MDIKMDKIIVGYERLSSKDQAFNSPAREQQKARLKAAGATEIYEDIESGRNDDRRQLKELMSKVANREVDEVIITKIDRLARSLPKIRECIKVFQETGVNLRILDQDINLNTPQGILMLNILGAVAEMEVALISDRVNHGKQHRRNKKSACESAPWGYVVDNDKYVLDNRPVLCLLEDRPPQNSDSETEVCEVFPGRSRAQIGREMIELFLQNRTLTGTLKTTYEKYGFNKIKTRQRIKHIPFSWSKSGFNGWLNNLVLCGHTVYNQSKIVGKKSKLNPREQWQIWRDTHPEQRLMTDEEAQEIQQILVSNQKLVGENFNRPLGSTQRQEYSYQTGLIYCRECGSRCNSKTSTSKGKTYSYFACRYSGLGCGNSQSVEKQKIEDFLLKFLIKTSHVMRSQLDDEGKSEVPKSARLIQLEEQLKAAEIFPGFNINNEQLKAELNQMISDEINLSRCLDNQTVEEIIRRGDNLSFWHTLSFEEKVAVYHRIVGKIFIRNGAVDSILLKAQTYTKQASNYEDSRAS